MTDDQPNHKSFAITAAAFEGSLAIVAVLLGWLFGIEPLASLRRTWAAVGWGAAGILPPLGLLAVCLVAPWRPLRHLREVVDRLLLPLFKTLSVAELAVISLLAGLGEELLFRGVIQGGLAEWIGGTAGAVIGLTVAGVLFGIAHAITPAYLMLAGLIGFYLGGLWLLSGNLLAPIIAHAGYDFVALVYLAKVRPGPQ